MPPIESTLEGSKTRTNEQVFGQEQRVVGDAVGLMRSFQRMSEALIIHLDRDFSRVMAPLEGP